MYLFRLMALTGVLFCTFLMPSHVLAADYPTIMVTIKPFYNLCAKIMQNVGEPKLLINGNGSPHDYQLKPSDAKLINESDLVIWGGPGIDGYIAKSLDNFGDSKESRSLDLSTVANLNLLPMRSSTNWEHEHHDHSGHSHDHSHDHFDAHFWLSPDNAKIIAQAIAERLSDIDPAHAKTYLRNAKDLEAELLRKEKVWNKQLAAYHGVPYLVFHDAYQYFNEYFGLDGVGAISIHPEIPPSAQRIEQIQTLLQEEKVRCIFSEPQFNYKIIDSLTDNLHVYKGVLDPLGQDKDMGPDGYLVLLDKLVDSFVLCGKFKPSSR